MCTAGLILSDYPIVLHCRSWAVKSQRSARGALSPLKASRASVWGSQSNLLSSAQIGSAVEAAQPLPEPKPSAIAVAMKEASRIDSKAETERTAVQLPADSTHSPTVGEPEVLAAPLLAAQSQPEPTQEALRLANDEGSAGEGGSEGLNGNLAAKPGKAVVGQQQAGNGIPPTPWPADLKLPTEQLSAVPATRCDPAVAQGMGCEQEAFAALMSTVAKVGIKPTAGTLLGTAVSRSKRVSKAAAEPTGPLPLPMPRQGATPNEIGSQQQGLPNRSFLPVAGLSDPSTADGSATPLQAVADLFPVTDFTGATTQAAQTGRKRSLSTTSLQPDWQSPLLLPLQEGLSGSKRMRRTSTLRDAGMPSRLLSQVLLETNSLLPALQCLGGV